MGPRSLALTLALTLAGCAGTDSGAATAGARQFVVAVGTPLYAVVKGATCVITAVGSLPVAALANAAPIGEPQDKAELTNGIYRMVGQTCGGSYALGDGAPP
jgi:hypothetical protein